VDVSVVFDPEVKKDSDSYAQLLALKLLRVAAGSGELVGDDAEDYEEDPE
jgi:hypothetical protein